MEKTSVAIKYPCPCCGYIVFSEPSGSYDICPICDWEDDDSQLREPTRGGGANSVSLIEAQKNFIEFGAKDKKHLAHVRKPTENDRRDEAWRIIDETKDALSISKEDFEKMYQEDPSKIYYWKK